MADKQKENKQAPDQSEPTKSEKSEKSSSITSPKPVTLPVAKTPIQACFLEYFYDKSVRFWWTGGYLW